MAKNNNISDFMRGIADVLRAVKGDSALINPQDFENEICSAIVNTPSLQTITERTTANGADIEDGVAFIKSIRGNSLKIGQKLKGSEMVALVNSKAPYLSPTLTSETTFSLNGTLTATYYLSLYNGNLLINGHKYLFKANESGTYSANKIRFYAFANGSTLGEGESFVFTWNSTNAQNLYMCPKNGAVIDNETFAPQLFDLTEMGMESITSADAFAQALGYSSASAMPALPYSATTIKHFNARKVVSKDADGEQIDTLDLASLDLWSAGSAYDEVDLAKGTKTKRIGKIDLGTLNWDYNSDHQRYYTEGISPYTKVIADYTNNAMLLGYKAGETSAQYGAVNHSFSGINNVLFIYNTDVADAAALKASLNGVYLYYELATPTTSSIDKAKAYFKVENGGKEMIANADGTLNTDSSPLKAEIGYKYNLEVSTTSEDGE